jgi:hypothetical protein
MNVEQILIRRRYGLNGQKPDCSSMTGCPRCPSHDRRTGVRKCLGCGFAVYP